MRLYVTAWVQLDGHEKPFQVQKDRNNAAVFNVGDWQYDIDARPMRTSPDAPRIARTTTAIFPSGYNTSPCLRGRAPAKV